MKNGSIAGMVILIIIIVAGLAYVFTSSGTHINNTHQNVSNSTVSTTIKTSTTAPTVLNNPTPKSNYTVNVAYNSVIGNYLVNSKGYTLYIFTTDIPYSGNSMCTGFCAGIWPSFYTANLIVPSSFNTLNFNTITRSNGTLQLTYMGRPLYVYSKDTAPGQINGEGFLGKWYAATFPVIITPGQSNATTANNIAANSIATTSIPASSKTNTTTVSGYGGYG